MASGLDLQKFTFEGDLLKSVRELIFEESFSKNPEINAVHQIWRGIVTNGEVGFIGEGGMLGVPTTYCDPQEQDWQVATRKMLWDPQTWEFLIGMCWKDLEGTAAVYSLRHGRDIPDFTDTDYMAIISEALSKSLTEMIWRFTWFGDKEAANVTSGVITSGVDVKYFKLIDGFWKQIMAQIGTANNKQRKATISENTGANYAAQTLNPDNVIGYLQSVVMGAPLALRSSSEAELLVTQSVYDAYGMALMGKEINATYQNLVNGQQSLSFNGVQLTPMPVWDKMIAAYENTGTKLNNPHRIVFTTKSTLAIGVDSETSYQDFSINYDFKTRKVYAQGFGKLDAKLSNPEMFTLGI